MDALSITVIECAPRLFAFTRRQVALKNLPAVAASLPLWGLVDDRGIETLNRTPICAFPDAAGDEIFSEAGVLIDIGLEVAAPFEGDLTLRIGETPSGRAAMVVFSGPYEAQIEDAHHAIRAWCREHSETHAGPILETYRWNEDPTLRETWVHYFLA